VLDEVTEQPFAAGEVCDPPPDGRIHTGRDEIAEFCATRVQYPEGGVLRANDFSTEVGYPLQHRLQLEIGCERQGGLMQAQQLLFAVGESLAELTPFGVICLARHS
jgi:hypothetical protein